MKNTRYRDIVIVRHGVWEEAATFADAVVNHWKSDRRWRIFSYEQAVEADISSADLIVVIGGDGTIMRAAHVALAQKTPLLGINIGRVGFLSEIDAADALDRLDKYLNFMDEDDIRIEERHMLSVERVGDKPKILFALNDVTIHRSRGLRVIEVEAHIDGAHLASYRGDGVVISTATGSTGYALSLGGPVMDPRLGVYLLKPIAAHMSQAGGAILPGESRLELTVRCGSPAFLSADGIFELSLSDGDRVKVEQSGFKTRFLRHGSPSSFWAGMSDRLGIVKTFPPNKKISSGNGR